MDYLLIAVALFAGIAAGWWLRSDEVNEARQEAHKLATELRRMTAKALEAEKQADGKLNELKALRKRRATIEGFAKDSRHRMQLMLAELNEAKANGRPVSVYRMRREIKKLLRWFND